MDKCVQMQVCNWANGVAAAARMYITAAHIRDALNQLQRCREELDYGETGDLNDVQKADTKAWWAMGHLTTALGENENLVPHWLDWAEQQKLLDEP